MGIFRTNSEAGKPIRSWPQRLNAILESICEAIGIQMDVSFTGPQVLSLSQKGAPNGVCELDGAGKIPINRLPASQVSAPNILPLTGADGKLSPTFFSSIQSLLYTTATLGSTGAVAEGQTVNVPINTPSGPLSSIFDGTRFVLPAQSGTYLVVIALFLSHYGVARLCPFEQFDGDSALYTVCPGTTYSPSFISNVSFHRPLASQMLIRPSLNVPSSSQWGGPHSVESAGGNQTNSMITIVKLSGA